MAPELSLRARQILDEVERDALARRAVLRPEATPQAPGALPDLHAELIGLADELVAQAERAWRWLERLDAALALPAPPAAPGASPTHFGDRARLTAVELAVAGHDRRAIREHLRAQFGDGDPDPLLDVIFGGDRAATRACRCATTGPSPREPQAGPATRGFTTCSVVGL